MSFHKSSAVLQENYDFAAISHRPPHEVRLMPADCLWKPIRRTEQVNRSSLSIVSGKNSGLATLLERKAVINVRHLRHQLRPPKLIAPLLRKRAVVIYFRLLRNHMQRLLVSNVLLRRKQRKRQRSRNRPGHNDRCNQRDLRPRSPLRKCRSVQPALDRQSAPCKEHGIRRRKVVILSMKNNECNQQRQIRPADEAVFSGRSEKEISQ